MSQRDLWKVGARVHHVEKGFGVITEAFLTVGYSYGNRVTTSRPSVPSRKTWTIQTKTWKRLTQTVSENDRAGWHLVNSATARSCTRCMYGKSNE